MKWPARTKHRSDGSPGGPQQIQNGLENIITSSVREKKGQARFKSRTHGLPLEPFLLKNTMADPKAKEQTCGLACSSFFCSSVFSRGTQSAPNAEMSAWWRRGSFATEWDRATREPKEESGGGEGGRVKVRGGMRAY